MPDMLYVGLQDDDKIAVFALDGDRGELTKRPDVAAPGGHRSWQSVQTAGRSTSAVARDHQSRATGSILRAGAYRRRGRQRRRMRRPFWRPTAPVATCCAPIIRVAMSGCIRSRRTT